MISNTTSVTTAPCYWNISWFSGQLGTKCVVLILLFASIRGLCYFLIINVCVPINDSGLLILIQNATLVRFVPMVMQYVRQ